jgi:hypothetical protein
MVMTKAQWQAAMDHVVVTVLAQGADDLISKAISTYGIHSPLDLLTVPPEDIEALTYVDDAG